MIRSTTVKPKVKQLSHSELVVLIVRELPKLDVIATSTNASAVKRHGGRYLLRDERVSDNWPDITGVLGRSYKQPGRAFLIETKVGRDKPNPGQMVIADELEKAGALVIREARSLEDVTSVLERERK